MSVTDRKAGLREMRRHPRFGRLTALLIAMVGTLLLAGWTGSTSSATPSSSAPTSAGSTLPRNVVVPLSVVNQYFPEVAEESSTGPNATAVGNPKATRSVIYATHDGARKVTITVDQYGSSNGASSAYQQAIQKSQIPGFSALPAPNVGQRAFAGTVTIGAETHVGIGALDGKLIVGATLAGYDATPDNTAKLAALTRREDATAKAALGVDGSPGSSSSGST